MAKTFLGVSNDCRWNSVEELSNFRSKEILIEVHHVEANRYEKERQHMSRFEKLSLKVMRKRMSDAGWMFYGAGQGKHDSAGKRRSVCSLAICSQLSLFGGKWKYCEELQSKPTEK